VHETVETSGIAPQPCLLTTNQAHMGHKPDHFCLACSFSSGLGCSTAKPPHTRMHDQDYKLWDLSP
jgi:hypothetical protein